MSSPVGRHVAGFSCPGCRSDGFDVLDDGDLTLFRCVACACCWRVELGFVGQVESSGLTSFRLHMSPPVP